MSDDLREALEGALEEQLQPEEEVVEEQTDIEEAIEAVEETETKERDEKGRFKAKEPEEEIEAVEPEQDKVEEVEVEAVEEVVETHQHEAPQSYSAAVREKWAEVPVEVQAEINKRENDIHQMMTRHDGELRMGREMKEIINPYMPLIQSMGGTPQQAVQETLNVAYLLNTGQPHQKAELINHLISRHQIDMSLLPDQDDPNSVISSLQKQVAHLQEQANPEAIRQQFEQEQITKEVQAFAADPANIHYEKVKPVMGSLLQSGAAKDMQEAYEMACRADPEIHSTLEQQKAKEAEAKRRQELEAKKKAAASVTGSPERTVTKPSAQNKSVRAELDAQWEEQSSASF